MLPNKQIRDLHGLIFNEWTVLRFDRVQNKNAYWLCRCSCGVEKTIACCELTRGRSKNCGHTRLEKLKRINADNPHFRGIGEISLSFFNRIRDNAKARKKLFDITHQEIWDLFLKQNRRCAFTGLELTFPISDQGKFAGTASLDRIDSSRGYTIDNVQWVHKRINAMKWACSDDEFISFCHLVSEHRRGV